MRQSILELGLGLAIKPALAFATALMLVLVYPHANAASTIKLEAPLLNSYVYHCKEDGNYGLHTYYILKAQPFSTEMDAAIEQTIFILSKIKRLNRKISFVPHGERNVLYIPVSLPTQGWLQDPQPDSLNAAARWILRYYDYDCANKILQNAGNKPGNNSGPFLISSLYKLAADSAFHTVTLTQDFSYVNRNARKFLLDTFFRRTWYRRVWDEPRLEQLGHTMQSTLDVYFSRDNSVGFVDIDTDEDTAAAEFVIPFIANEPDTEPVTEPVIEPVTESTADPETDPEKAAANPLPDTNIAEINAQPADNKPEPDAASDNTRAGGYVHIHYGK